MTSTPSSRPAFPPSVETNYRRQVVPDQDRLQGGGPDAVIYCRVSTDRQVKEGDGARSQEQRCRAYAQAHKQSVLATFTDDGVSGAATAAERPGFLALLTFLRSRSDETVVLVDDISRLARDVSAHFTLRTAIKAAGGRLESPSFTFGDTAADELIETILAATAQFGRKGNREQVFNRMRARLEQGYWTFPEPPGYRYQRHPIHKKWLVPTREATDVLGPALAAFGRGRFGTLRELALHLDAQRFFGAAGLDQDRPGAAAARRHVTVLDKRMTRIMDSLPLYAGLIAYPKWGIERRTAQHQPILTPPDLARIEARLSGRTPIPIVSTKAATDQLPLRNFVRCPGCGRPLTGNLAKGRYARYFCYFQPCALYGRSYSAKKDLHPAFVALLRSLEPSPAFLELGALRAKAVWNARQKERVAEGRLAKQELGQIEMEIAGLVRRLGKVSSEAVAEALEGEIGALKERESRLRQSLATAERGAEQSTDFPNAWKAVSTWFCDPAGMWESGSASQKKTVYRLVFSVPPVFDRKTGLSTYELSLPYRVSGAFSEPGGGVVDSAGEKWHLSGTDGVDGANGSGKSPDALLPSVPSTTGLTNADWLGLFDVLGQWAEWIR